jgi:nicotinate-nucleotide pyrophosphorylase (carboxylating)
MLNQAVALCRGRILTEASGNITLATIRSVAETGVDFISSGSLTKDVHAIDLSMRIIIVNKLDNNF